MKYVEALAKIMITLFLLPLLRNIIALEADHAAVLCCSPVQLGKPHAKNRDKKSIFARGSVVVVLFFIFGTGFAVFPDDYDRFLFRKDQELYIETIINNSSMVNGLALGKSESVERGIQYVNSVDRSGNATIRGETFIMDSTKYTDGQYFKLNKNIKYVTKKSPDGRSMDLSVRYGLHDFPQLPMRVMKIGDTYETDSVFIIPLFKTGLPDVNLDIRFVNRYLGVEERQDGKKMSVYSCRGVVNRELARSVLNKAKIFKVVGFTDNIIKFNRAEGAVYTIEEYYDWTFILYDMTIIESSGTAVTYFRTPPPLSAKTLEKMFKNIMNQNDIKMGRDLLLTINIENIGFKADSFDLTDEEKIRIDKIAVNLKDNGVSKMVIKGHTANVGRKDIQLKLSEERAKAVLDYFCEKHGFDRKSLSFTGVGGTEPVDSNDTDEGRARNRRVELIIMPE